MSVRWLVTAALLSLASANAATVTFFVSGGMLQDGSSITGTITVDTTMLDVTATNITLGAPDSQTCTSTPSAQGAAGSVGYFVFLTCGANSLHLILSTPNDTTNGTLSGYTGGSISSSALAFYIASTDPVTAGSLTTTPPTPPTPPDAFQVGYAANVGPNGGGGESFVNITNNGASATTPGTGNLCINIYTFDPTEEMLSCCACQVSPNGLASLGVNSSLLTNTLTSEQPGSAVIKLLASAGTTSGCDPTSPGTSANPLAPGLRAWSTIQHATTNPTTVGLTEIPFSKSDLSAQELNHVTANCAFILSLLPTGGTSASGFGICKGCATGGM